MARAREPLDKEGDRHCKCNDGADAEEDIGIVFTGMRPGEKLYEELLNDNEIHESQVYPKIYVGKASMSSIHQIDSLIQSFARHTSSQLRQEIMDIVYNRKEVASELAVLS